MIAWPSGVCPVGYCRAGAVSLGMCPSDQKEPARLQVLNTASEYQLAIAPDAEVLGISER